MAGLAASVVVAYLLLGRTQAADSPWALFALTAAAAVVLSTLLSATLDDQTATLRSRPEPAARTESTGAEASPEGTELETTFETTLERAAPATGGTSASASASAGASPPASASASASP